MTTNFERIKNMSIDEMSEIEKMYICCKIKKQQTCSRSDTCYNGSLNECEGCNAYQYPPFTAEKQLKLIKWLIANGHCYFTVTIKPDEFEKYLARYINNVWKDLTEQEKAEIKRILE